MLIDHSWEHMLIVLSTVIVTYIAVVQGLVWPLSTNLTCACPIYPWTHDKHKLPIRLAPTLQHRHINLASQHDVMCCRAWCGCLTLISQVHALTTAGYMTSSFDRQVLCQLITQAHCRCDVLFLVQGLVWVLNMYLTGACPDYRYSHDNQPPTARQLAQAIVQLQSSGKPQEVGLLTRLLVLASCVLQLSHSTCRY